MKPSCLLKNLLDSLFGISQPQPVPVKVKVSNRFK